MLKIDNSLLAEIGLDSLPSNEKNGILKHMYETLEIRVGARLADQMTDAQLSEFEQYFEAKDDQGAFKWLETNFPNYKDIVQAEFTQLKGEVTAAVPQILAEASAAAQQAPQNIASPQQPQYSQDPNQSVGQQQPPQYPETSAQPDFPTQQPPAGPQQ